MVSPASILAHVYPWLRCRSIKAFIFESRNSGVLWSEQPYGLPRLSRIPTGRPRPMCDQRTLEPRTRHDAFAYPSGPPHLPLCLGLGAVFSVWESFGHRCAPLQAGRPLGSATHRCHGEPLPHHLANKPRAPKVKRTCYSARIDSAIPPLSGYPILAPHTLLPCALSPPELVAPFFEAVWCTCLHSP